MREGGGWRGGGRGANPREWTVAARENARGGIQTFSRGWTRPCASTNDRTIEARRGTRARTAPPVESSSQLLSSHPRARTAKQRRGITSVGANEGPPTRGRDLRPLRGAHMRGHRRDAHAPRASHEASSLAVESESEPPIEVVVSTSDTQLCGLLEADGAPMTRCVTHRGRVGAPLVPSERDFVKRIPGDSRSRFEWYWRETVDTAVALVTSDTAVEPAMTLFLEDDVVPTKAWETKLRRLIAPYASSVDGRACEFDVFVLYAEGLVQVNDGERGRSRRTPRRCSSARGWRRGSRRRCWTGSGRAPGLARSGHKRRSGGRRGRARRRRRGNAPEAARDLFANPPLFQHGCEHSTLREKAGEAGANVRAMSTHRSRSFRAGDRMRGTRARGAEAREWWGRRAS